MAEGQIGRGSAETQASQENHWIQLAQKSWSKGRKYKNVTVDFVKKELWDPLEKEDFDFKSLVQLESLQLLEYLWHSYSDASTNYHVLIVAFLVTAKSREDLPVWDSFANDPESFASFFRRVLSLSLDESLSVTVRTLILSFLITAFQSLDNGLVRKECAPLVSISIWHNLSNETSREGRLEGNVQLKKTWRASLRRYEAAEEDHKARLRFERSWLFTLLLDFISRLYRPSKGMCTRNSLSTAADVPSEDIRYDERFLELLTDLESQLPTRRYVTALLKDLNILALINLSPTFNAQENGLLRDLYALLRHYVNFPIDDTTGIQLSRDEALEMHYQKLARLQRISLKNFKSKLTILALANYGSIDKRQDLEAHLEQLEDAELGELCSQLGLRTSYPPAANIQINRILLMEILMSTHEVSKPFQSALKSMNILPTETSLYEPALLRNETYDGSRSLAIPKLNLQYLSIGDFLWRSFILYRCEQFFEIRKYLEDIVKRLQPHSVDPSGRVGFRGFSRMALPIAKPAILESAAAKVGQDQPAYVRAEITLNVGRLAESVRREWDALRPEDTVYLLAIQPAEDPGILTNGHSSKANIRESGIVSLRTAEVVQLLDEKGRLIRDSVLDQSNDHSRRPQVRRLLVNLDATAFVADITQKEKGKVDIYESINIVVRRSQRENNFRKILETIQTLALSEVVVPVWLQEVLLGYGDPASATFTRLENRLTAIDFRDTFLDWQHLLDSFPGKTIEANSKREELQPPYILDIPTVRASEIPPKSSKKRRRDDVEPTPQDTGTVRASTYETPNTGPYPNDAPKRNRIRFTPIQVQAITSGTQPGLTMIVGPPGTGKTDVATQIINNIYHDFPEQRTLLIAHSNQALNQLFQKIMKLDIDGRHLLRLGQGEGDLETEESFSKLGRVESFLDNRARYLAEVDRLAANFGAPGAHGNSCETAGYFNSVYNIPAWSKFWDFANSTEDSHVIVRAFPFNHYFSNVQQLFPPGASREVVFDIAKGCQRHIDKIFSELEDIRPFELLRNNRDKTNYLMVKEARIIAMTSTHAAMRRQEIADLGFHYDNVIMEEAAQITEIENFIPLALQDPQKGESPLQRIVLCGDHLQNSPIIQNMAFRQYANLEQSLFLRLVRLGVPTINLDHQGRARPSIADLYKWRYQTLSNLPNVLTQPEYLQANAGFRYEYQFVDVGEYKGKGESQPSSHFFQNLGEAEYAVAIYQYMRLLGYPASKISILTPYAGQRALVRDVLSHRCHGNRLFGMPRIVTTVDKYQGEQNDYIILSLVRTSRPGYLRDIRRLTVALSRARLGLYILGRRSVFENSPELANAFKLPMERPAKLMITTGETWPSQRGIEDVVEGTEMVGVEHLGQYVFEMTQAKVRMLKEGHGILPPQESEQVLDMDPGMKDEEETRFEAEEQDERGDAD